MITSECCDTDRSCSDCLHDAGSRQRPKGPKLASVLSEPFDVVTWEAYPGRPAKGMVQAYFLILRTPCVVELT